MAGSSKPDLSTVKKRLSEQEVVPQAPPTAAPLSNRVSPTTAAFVTEYTKAEARMQSAEQVVLDTAESVKTQEELAAAKDPIYYRNNTYDCRATRLKIEDLCEPMDFGELVLSGRVTQTVPVVPKKFLVTFQSLTGAEEFWLAENTPKETTGQLTPIMWLGYHRVVMMIRAMNNSDLPNHTVNGLVSQEVIASKLDKVLSIGDKLLDRIMTNMHWFNYRVDKLIDEDIETLKNG